MKHLYPLFATATILGIVACGGGNGVAPATNAADAGGEVATTSTSTTDAGCSGAGLTDEPDDQGTDDNCDGVDGVAASDVYVNPATGADTNDASPLTPLRTLPAALRLAATRGARVFLVKGTYAMDTLKASTDVQIFGGYDATFLGPPHRENTTLRASATGLLVDGSSAHVSFSHLTIEGESASDQISAYGLRLQAGDIAIDDVVVSSGDALVGTTGNAGADAPEAISTYAWTSITCNGVQQPSYTAGSMACPAADGTPGENGIDGANAGAPILITRGLLAQSTGAGSGGAGKPGAGGVSCLLGYWTYPGGHGGCPGEPGKGGTSGGSSVSVLAFGGSFAASRSLFRTGLAGTGGDGGAGGLGSNGVTANGFTGGKGGHGGHGGGGVGGSTVGVLSWSSVPVEIDSSTTYDLGPAGRGGIGRAGVNAPSGRGIPVLSIDVP